MGLPINNHIRQAGSRGKGRVMQVNGQVKAQKQKDIRHDAKGSTWRPNSYRSKDWR